MMNLLGLLAMKSRGFLVTIVFLALVLPAFAQEPPRGRGPAGSSMKRAEIAKQARGRRARGQRTNPRLAMLSAVLELTDAQQVAIKEIGGSQRGTLRELHKSLREAQGRVKAAITEGSASNVGTAVLASAEIRKSIGAAQKKFKTDLTNVLTAAQNERLQKVIKATRGSKMGRGNKPPRKGHVRRGPGGKQPPGK